MNEIWKANYYHRQKKISDQALKNLKKSGYAPEFQNKKVQHYSLKDYIEFLGVKESAETFDCSEASIKAWRYGYRNPSIKQAHQIIKATEGKLTYESIFGNIQDLQSQMFQINLSEEDSPYELAMAYYEEGLSVIPLQRKDKKPPKNLGSWEEYKTKRPEREKVEEWFKDRDDLVVAIVCGKFIVVDADTPEAMTWVEENLPVTPYKVITGKGMHFYYNNPQNFKRSSWWFDFNG